MNNKLSIQTLRNNNQINYGQMYKMTTKKLPIPFRELKMLLLLNLDTEIHFCKKILTLFNFLSILVTLLKITLSKKNHGIKSSKYYPKLLQLLPYRLMLELLTKLLNCVINYLENQKKAYYRKEFNIIQQLLFIMLLELLLLNIFQILF